MSDKHNSIRQELIMSIDNLLNSCSLNKLNKEMFILSLTSDQLLVILGGLTVLEKYSRNPLEGEPLFFNGKPLKTGSPIEESRYHSDIPDGSDSYFHFDPITGERDG